MIWTCLIWMGLAMAHDPGLSHAEVRQDAVTVVLAAAEAEAVTPDVRIVTPSGDCAVGSWSQRVVEEDGIAWTASLDCPAGTLTYHADFLASAPPGHRHVVQGEGAPLVLDASRPSGDLAAVASGFPWALGGAFLVQGIEHVLWGFDHVAFLLALLLVARSTRQVAAVITTFTVAHSLTLVGASLGAFSAPGWLVEPVIAGSIVYAGLDNLWRPERPHRLWLIFGLGLVHGLGFAGALSELGLPTLHALWALLAFNGGVELGQLMVAAVSVPVIAWAARSSRWEQVMLPACSVAVALLGAWWLVERIA